jgi:hypothetical protein
MPTTKSNRFLSTEEIYKDQIVLAFVIDGEVVDTLVCNERLAAILQSTPTVVELKNKDIFLNGPHVGWKYDGINFIKPDIDLD